MARQSFAHRLVLVTLSWPWMTGSAFTPLSSLPVRRSMLLQAANSDNESSSLQKRLRELQESEQRQEALQYRNWDMGNWNQESLDVKCSVTAVCASAEALFLADAVGQVKQVMTDTTPPSVERVWNVTKNTPIQALAYSEEEEMLVCASKDGMYMIRLDEEEEEIVETLSNADASDVQSLFVVEHGSDWRIVAVRTTTAHIYSVQSDTLEQVATVDVTAEDPQQDFNNDDDTSITSCALDASRHSIYLGLSTGHVQAYQLQSNGFQFLARWKMNNQETPITALRIGPDILVNARQEMTVLLTGDADGHLQQWFLHGTRIWPQMATQRLPNRAHVFPAQRDAISSIQCIDAVHFVSCSVDGTVRAWNAKSGQERFVLTGFESTPHLLVGDHGLITVDGSGVAFHQFNVETPDDFDLEMPEYLE